METLFNLDDNQRKLIESILTNITECEQCGGDADDCGCAAMTEDLDVCNDCGKKHDPEEACPDEMNEEKEEEQPEEIQEESSFFVGRRKFSDKKDADSYAKHIGGTVTPTSNPTHKGFEKDSPAHHPLHNIAAKHGYEYTGAGTTTRGGGSVVHRHEYKHPITHHTATLGTHSKDGADQHFWQHQGQGNTNPRHHGITSPIEYTKLKGSFHKHLKKTHTSPE